MIRRSLAGSTARLIGYVVRDVARSRWLLGYALVLVAVTDILFRFGGVQPNALLGAMNLALLIVPLVSLVFGAAYVYDGREFIELLLAQPLGRPRLFAALYLGLTLPLIAAFAVALVLVGLIHAVWSSPLGATLATLLSLGAVLTAVFTAIAVLVAIRVQDKVRGLGVAIGLWLLAAVLYDGVVLVLTTMFADQPLERPLLALMVANPIDLARVLLLLQFDTPALMGYTGATFRQFFGDATGLAVASTALALWIALPAWRGVRAFQRKDF